jgi:hypothetical protein
MRSDHGDNIANTNGLMTPPEDLEIEGLAGGGPVPVSFDG